MSKKIDYDSVVNQDIKGKFVQREVLACFSYEMEAILRASNGQGRTDEDYPLPGYEDIINLYEFKCPNCGSRFQNIGDFGQETENSCEFHCPDCDSHFDEEPESEPQEIFEWWIVTDFLAEKLRAKGCPVLEWGNNWYWGRCTTGQAILLDWVISQICKEMEILEGQKYDWSK